MKNIAWINQFLRLATGWSTRCETLRVTQLIRNKAYGIEFNEIAPYENVVLKAKITY